MQHLFCLSGVYVIRSILSRRMRLNTKPKSSQSHNKAEVWKPKVDVITIPQGSSLEFSYTLYYTVPFL